ncbi:MAG: hypothetical protein ACTS5A_01335 [Candidatus Hodgkinia cicadicola]
MFILYEPSRRYSLIYEIVFNVNHIWEFNYFRLIVYASVSS